MAARFNFRTRVAALIVGLTFAFAATVAVAAAAPAPAWESAPFHPHTPEQAELVEWAKGRFAAAGLELPEVEIRFHHDITLGAGREGAYRADAGILHMFTDAADTLLHELAHAWAGANLSKGDRARFAASRRLSNWNSHDDEWENRATEHAAEIITWALMDRPTHVRWIEENPDGTATVTHRLLTIPDSDVHQLVAGYVSLTGSDPTFRDPAEWAA